jgi:periplasmic protein TonB
VLPVAFPGSADRVYAVEQLDVMPRVLRRVAPRYPANARRAGLEGEVTLGFDVSPTGQVENIAVVQSNDPRFEEAAMEAMRQWRLSPGLREGEPVRVRMMQTIKFSLGG